MWSSSACDLRHRSKEHLPAFGPKMDTLLRMQTAFEIAEAREREADFKVKRYVAKSPTAREHAAQSTL